MLPSAGFFEYGTQRYEKIAKAEDESAILLRGKIEEATGDKEKAESSYQKVTESMSW